MRLFGLSSVYILFPITGRINHYCILLPPIFFPKMEKMNSEVFIIVLSEQNNFYDNILLTVLNEHAHALGLIDEKTWYTIRKEIQILELRKT